MGAAVQFNIAGAGANFEGRPPAVDGGGQVVAGVAVLLRGVGEVDAYVTGTGRGFQVEVGIRREVEPDRAGAAGDVGFAGETAFDLDVA